MATGCSKGLFSDLAIAITEATNSAIVTCWQARCKAVFFWESKTLRSAPELLTTNSTITKSYHNINKGTKLTLQKNSHGVHFTKSKDKSYLELGQVTHELLMLLDESLLRTSLKFLITPTTSGYGPLWNQPLAIFISYAIIQFKSAFVKQDLVRLLYWVSAGTENKSLPFLL